MLPIHGANVIPVSNLELRLSSVGNSTISIGFFCAVRRWMEFPRRTPGTFISGTRNWRRITVSFGTPRVSWTVLVLPSRKRSGWTCFACTSPRYKTVDGFERNVFGVVLAKLLTRVLKNILILPTRCPCFFCNDFPCLII